MKSSAWDPLEGLEIAESLWKDSETEYGDADQFEGESEYPEGSFGHELET